MLLVLVITFSQQQKKVLVLTDFLKKKKKIDVVKTFLYVNWSIVLCHVLRLNFLIFASIKLI